MNHHDDVMDFPVIEGWKGKLFEQRNGRVDLVPVKRKIDKLFGDDREKQKLYWSTFVKFIRSKISKNELLQVLYEKINIPKLIPLHNYFVKSVLHNARIGITQPKREFEEYCSSRNDLIKQPDTRGSFGTLITSSLIDFDSDSQEESFLTVLNPKERTNYHFNSCGYTYGSNYRIIKNSLPELKNVQDKLEVMKVKSHQRVPGYLVVASEYFLKNIISQLIQVKQINKKVIEFDDTLLKDKEVVSPRIVTFRNEEYKSRNSYYHYMDDVEEEYQLQKLARKRPSMAVEMRKKKDLLITARDFLIALRENRMKVPKRNEVIEKLQNLSWDLV